MVPGGCVHGPGGGLVGLGSTHPTGMHSCLTVIHFKKRGLLKRLSFITVRKRSCGKVMFSQACVENSVHGWVSARHPPGR